MLIQKTVNLKMIMIANKMEMKKKIFCYNIKSKMKSQTFLKQKELKRMWSSEVKAKVVSRHRCPNVDLIRLDTLVTTLILPRLVLIKKLNMPPLKPWLGNSTPYNSLMEIELKSSEALE